MGRVRLLTEEEVGHLRLAMQDVVAGARVLERARRQAVGREIDFGGGNA